MKRNKVVKIKEKTDIKRAIWKNKWLYVMLIPMVVQLAIFNYTPMYGLIMSFQDYNPVKGYFESEFVGLKHFITLFNSEDFWIALKNTLLLSTYSIIWGFPVPIIVAIMLHEVQSSKFRKSVQTIVYFPHFISWVVILGMITNFLSPTTGLVNHIITSMGGEPVAFLTKSSCFRTIIVASGIWKETGWGTVIYMAALAGIDTQVYEAAYIDGATRMQRIKYVTIPGIMGVISLQFIMRLSGILNNSFEQVYMLYNPMIYDVADVLETYSYRSGLLGGRYSYAAALGFMKSIVGLVFMLTANKISSKVNNLGMW